MRTLQSLASRLERMASVGACLSMVALAACTKAPPEAATPAPPATVTEAPNEAANELKWARLALARNPTLEIIAIDPAAGVFTVRFKDSGEIRAVKPGDLAAMPISALIASTRPNSMPEPPTAATPAAPTATPATAAMSSQAAAPTASVAQSSSSSSSGYTIERTDGQLKVSGPGVSIVSTGTAAVPASANDPGQRGADPIICEGRRMLHFDNRNIYVEGDAIIARGGCELYITNSRVVADGTGIVVRDAVVHISNSTIEGGAASFDADDTAKVYVRGSTFQGLPRRSERTLIQDQGGNQWR
jgi:hypothetical protein